MSHSAKSYTCVSRRLGYRQGLQQHGFSISFGRGGELFDRSKAKGRSARAVNFYPSQYTVFFSVPSNLYIFNLHYEYVHYRERLLCRLLQCCCSHRAERMRRPIERTRCQWAKSARRRSGRKQGAIQWEDKGPAHQLYHVPGGHIHHRADDADSAG